MKPAAYLSKRIGEYLLALGILVILSFLLPRLMAGDPLTAMYGSGLGELTAELRAVLRERFGLEQSIWVQFFLYLKGLLTGDLGYSIYRSAKVSAILGAPLAWTLLLAGSSLLLSLAFGVIIGVEIAWRTGRRFERWAVAGFLVLFGLPEYFVGSLLVLGLAVHGGVFPLSGALTEGVDLPFLSRLLDLARHLALPVLTLTLVQLPGIFLLMRASMVGVMGRGHIQTARGKGVRERIIRYRHAARAALVPVATQTGIRIGTLTAGALFVETVFAYPGLGYLTYDALLHHDYPVLHGVLLLLSVLVLLANLLTDLLVAKLDPRINDAHDLRSQPSI